VGFDAAAFGPALVSERLDSHKRGGLDTAARKGKHGGRPPVITDDMLHTVLRRRAGGESVEQIQPDLLIPTTHSVQPCLALDHTVL
jgi:hypothetical protein